MEPLETWATADKVVLLYHDDSPENPREMDTLCSLWIKAPAYRFDEAEQDGVNLDDFHSVKDLVEYAVSERGAVWTAPVYKYEHGAIQLSLGDFGDPWDSGCIGIGIVTEERLKEWGIEKAQIEGVVKAELDEYTNYINGWVYGYRSFKRPPFEPGTKAWRRALEDLYDEDEYESCWGFYDMKDLLREAFGKGMKDAKEI